VNAEDEKTGSQLKPRPLPCTRAVMPTTRNRPRTISSAMIIILVKFAVILMPRRLISVFAPTKMTSHAQNGTSGTAACIVSDAIR
jgi:hypothetical protein